MNASENGNSRVSLRRKLAFSTGEVGDGVAYQSFSFLIFTFYFTVVKLPVTWISLGFIAWSFWNSINDPLIGYLSDRTKTSKGRRIPWMIGGTIPLALIMVLLFTPPAGSEDNVLKFVYFLVMLFGFDTAYTCFNLNYNASFSEIFVSVKDRAEVGRLRIIFVVFSLILAFVLPTIIIEDLANQNAYPYTQDQYILNGIIAAIIVVVTYIINLKWGMKNTKEFSKDAETAMGMKENLKHVLKNKTFLLFIIPALGTWIVIGILPTVIPLWATYVLKVNEDDSLLTGLLLLAAFFTAGLSTPFWTEIRQKKDARTAGMLGVAVWGCAVLTYLLANELVMGVVSMVFVGFGLGGGLYFYDQCIAEIIDEDEVRHGTRRAGTYYGAISFIIRLAGVINFVMIGLVFSGSEWETYSPNPGLDVLLGLNFLIAIYPALVLLASFIGLYFYPIKGKHLLETRVKLDKLHSEKRTNALKDD